MSTNTDGPDDNTVPRETDDMNTKALLIADNMTKKVAREILRHGTINGRKATRAETEAARETLSY